MTTYIWGRKKDLTERVKWQSQKPEGPKPFLSPQPQAEKEGMEQGGGRSPEHCTSGPKYLLWEQEPHIASGSGD